MIPDSAHVYYNRGKAKRGLLDYEGAILDYNKAIQLNPAFKEAIVSRAVAKTFLGDREGAIADYDRCTALFPAYAMPYYNRGGLYLEEKKHELALADFKLAVELDPKYLKAIMAYADLLAYLGKKDQACIYYLKAEKLGDGAAISKRLFNCK